MSRAEYRRAKIFGFVGTQALGGIAVWQPWLIPLIILGLLVFVPTVLCVARFLRRAEGRLSHFYIYESMHRGDEFLLVVNKKTNEIAMAYPPRTFLLSQQHDRKGVTPCTQYR